MGSSITYPTRKSFRLRARGSGMCHFHALASHRSARQELSSRPADRPRFAPKVRQRQGALKSRARLWIRQADDLPCSPNPASVCGQRFRKNARVRESIRQCRCPHSDIPVPRQGRQRFRPKIRRVFASRPTDYWSGHKSGYSFASPPAPQARWWRPAALRRRQRADVHHARVSAALWNHERWETPCAWMTCHGKAFLYRDGNAVKNAQRLAGRFALRLRRIGFFRLRQRVFTQLINKHIELRIVMINARKHALRKFDGRDFLRANSFRCLQGAWRSRVHAARMTKSFGLRHSLAAQKGPGMPRSVL